jgi:hypothetical protein
MLFLLSRGVEITNAALKRTSFGYGLSRPHDSILTSSIDSLYSVIVINQLRRRKFESNASATSRHIFTLPTYNDGRVRTVKSPGSRTKQRPSNNGLVTVLARGCTLACLETRSLSRQCPPRPTCQTTKPHLCILSFFMFEIRSI